MKEKTALWLEFVKRDLKAAEELLPTEYLANVVLFHCQQTKEIYEIASRIVTDAYRFLEKPGD